MIVRSLLTLLGFKTDSKGVNKYNMAIKGLIKTTVGLAAVGAAGIAALGTAFLKGAGEIEQVEIAFETMLGSAAKADKLLKDITQFAASTPFELTGLITSSKQLLAFGIGSDKIIDTMTTMGNIAAGVGRDKLPTMVRAFGKIRTKGKATMEELNMFLEAGVPILDSLAKNAAVSTEELFKMITAGKVGFGDVEKALTSMGTGTGQFANLMQKQSKSLLGIFSNIKDSITNMVNAIGKELLPDGKRMAKMLLNWLDLNKAIIKTNIVRFFKGVASVIQRVVSFFKEFSVIGNVVDLFKFIIAVIKVFGGAVDRVFGDSVNGGVKAIAKWIETNRDMITSGIVKFILSLGSAFEKFLRVAKVVFKIFFAISKKTFPILLKLLSIFIANIKTGAALLKLFTIPMKAVSAALKAFFALLRGDRNLAKEIISDFVNLVRTLTGGFVDSLKGSLNAYKDLFLKVFMTILEIIKPIITKIVNAWIIFKDALGRIWTIIVDNVKIAVGKIKDFFISAFSTIKDFIKDVIDQIIVFFNPVVEFVEDIIAKVDDLINKLDIGSKINSLKQKVSEFFGLGDNSNGSQGNIPASVASGISRGSINNTMTVNAEITVPVGTPVQQTASLQQSADEIFNKEMRKIWNNSSSNIPALEQ